MIGRPLMTVDELKSMPKGQFIVMKTGTHPMISKLKLFFNGRLNLRKNTVSLIKQQGRFVTKIVMN